MSTTPFSEADISRHVGMQCRSTGTHVQMILHYPFVKVEQKVEEIAWSTRELALLWSTILF